MSLAAQAAEVAGRRVTVAVPLHRLDPRVVNGVGLVEIAIFATLVINASGILLGLLAVVSTVFVSLHLADARRVLVIHDDGTATILSARRDGRPVAARTSLHRPPTLPTPAGLASPVHLDGTQWWIDRAAYPLLLPAPGPTPPP